MQTVFGNEALRRAPDFLRTPPELASRAARNQVGSNGFQVAITDYPKQTPTPERPRRKRRRNINKFQKFGCFAFWSDERRQNFARRIFGTERRARRGFTASRRKPSQEFGPE